MKFSKDKTEDQRDAILAAIELNERYQFSQCEADDDALNDKIEAVLQAAGIESDDGDYTENCGAALTHEKKQHKI